MDTISINFLIEKLAVGPRRVLGLPIPKIEVGAAAELTIFQPDERWFFSEKDIRSKSKNTPFIGRKLTGRASEQAAPEEPSRLFGWLAPRRSPSS